MVDKNSLFGGMLTTQGAAKKTNCDALGIPWEPRYMLIGDANGTDPVPSPTQKKLVNQVYRAQLNQLRVSPTDANILIAELVLPPDVGGWWIRELALEDADGVFSAVANAAPSYKPLLVQGSGRNQVVRMHIITSGTANIQLKIDPSVVLATRQYVDTAVNGLLPANKLAGTYRRVVVSERGVVQSGDNPTTLSGFGITNAFTKTETTDLIGAALAVPVVSVEASRPLLANELGLVSINASAGAVTIDLPAADAALGVRDVLVRRIDNTVNRLMIQAAGTDKIKFHTHLRPAGYAFFVLMGAGDYWHLRSDGAGSWFPVARLDTTPVGRPVAETTTAFSPGGWGLYHGLIYNRAEWPWLWDHAQASGMLTTEALRVGKEGCWTDGDGASTFRSPEGRAEYPRFLDESRGIDVGRTAGSSQGDAIRNITGSVSSVYRSATNSSAGALRLNPYGSSPGKIGVVGADPGDNSSISFDASLVVPTASENRSRNIANPGRIKMI